MDTLKLLSKKIDFSSLINLSYGFDPLIATYFMQILDVSKIDKFTFIEVENINNAIIENADEIVYKYCIFPGIVEFKTLSGYIVLYCKKNAITIETYDHNNLWQSFNNSPSEISFDCNGALRYMAFHKNGYLHRVNKPAVVMYSSAIPFLDSRKWPRLLKEWYINGNLHNIISPARIIIYEKSCKCSYAIHGTIINKSAFVEKQTKLQEMLDKENNI